MSRFDTKPKMFRAGRGGGRPAGRKNRARTARPTNFETPKHTQVAYVFQRVKLKD
jgi:hypothetical protein